MGGTLNHQTIQCKNSADLFIVHLLNGNMKAGAKKKDLTMGGKGENEEYDKMMGGEQRDVWGFDPKHTQFLELAYCSLQKLPTE